MANSGVASVESAKSLLRALGNRSARNSYIDKVLSSINLNTSTYDLEIVVPIPEVDGDDKNDDNKRGHQVYNCHAFLVLHHSPEKLARRVSSNGRLAIDFGDNVEPEAMIDTVRAFPDIVEWMYCRDVRREPHESSTTAESKTTRVERLESVARRLGFYRLLDECETARRMAFDPSQAAGMYEYAARRGHTSLSKLAYETMRDHLKVASTSPISSEAFLRLPVDVVHQLLSDQQLVVDSELNVLDAALRWLCHDWNSRLKHAALLVSEVRFDAMSLKELLRVTVEHHSNRLGCNSLEDRRKVSAILIETLECQNLLMNAYRDRLLVHANCCCPSKSKSSRRRSCSAAESSADDDASGSSDNESAVAAASKIKKVNVQPETLRRWTSYFVVKHLDDPETKRNRMWHVFKSLRNADFRGRTCEIEFVVDNCSFLVHRFLLLHNNPTLVDKLSTGTTSNRRNVVHLDTVSYVAFDIVYRWIYADSFEELVRKSATSSTTINIDHLREALKFGSKMKFNEFVSRCSHLMKLFDVEHRSEKKADQEKDTDNADHVRSYANDDDTNKGNDNVTVDEKTDSDKNDEKDDRVRTMTEEQAAIVIQKNYRGHATRKKLAEDRTGPDKVEYRDEHVTDQSCTSSVHQTISRDADDDDDDDGSSSDPRLPMSWDFKDKKKKTRRKKANDASASSTIVSNNEKAKGGEMILSEKKDATTSSLSSSSSSSSSSSRETSFSSTSYWSRETSHWPSLLYTVISRLKPRQQLTSDDDDDDDIEHNDDDDDAVKPSSSRKSSFSSWSSLESDNHEKTTSTKTLKNIDGETSFEDSTTKSVHRDRDIVSPDAEKSDTPVLTKILEKINPSSSSSSDEDLSSEEEDQGENEKIPPTSSGASGATSPTGQELARKRTNRWNRVWIRTKALDLLRRMRRSVRSKIKEMDSATKNSQMDDGSNELVMSENDNQGHGHLMTRRRMLEFRQDPETGRTMITKHIHKKRPRSKAKSNSLTSGRFVREEADAEEGDDDDDDDHKYHRSRALKYLTTRITIDSDVFTGDTEKRVDMARPLVSIEASTTGVVDWREVEFLVNSSPEYLLVGGVRHGQANDARSSVLKFNVKQMRWVESGRWPVARKNAAIVSNRCGDVFVTGGYGLDTSEADEAHYHREIVTDTVFRYRHGTTGSVDRPHSWTKMASMRDARAHHSAVICRNLLVVIGGIDQHRQILSSVEGYRWAENRGDASPKGWSRLPDLPSPRMGAATRVRDDRRTIIVAGGLIDGERRREPTDSVLVFTLGDNSWSNMDPLRRPKAFACLMSNDVGLFLIGGLVADDDDDESFISSDEIEVCPWGDQEWAIESHMSEARHFAGAAFIGDYLMVIGGSQQPFNKALVSGECYDVREKQWFHGMPDMPFAVNGGTFLSVDDRRQANSKNLDAGTIRDLRVLMQRRLLVMADQESDESCSSHELSEGDVTERAT